MQGLDFEWDDAKARVNLRKHGVGFDQAIRVFDDLLALESYDDRIDYGEDRFNITGFVDGRLIAVTYTPRSHRIRIITARFAEKHEADFYFANRDR